MPIFSKINFTKLIFIFLITVLLFTMLMPVFAEDKVSLNIIYPGNNKVINASSTFIIGNTNPDANLTVNGNPVTVYPNGGFVAMVNLKRGNNSITLKSTLAGEEKNVLFNIKVPEYEGTIPHAPLVINKGSIIPSSNIMFKPGDVLNVRFKGSTGNKAVLSIGKKNIPMIEEPSKTLATGIPPLKGYYSGSYIIQDTDNFKDIPVIVSLSSQNQSISQTAFNLTTLPKDFPLVGEIITNKATVRTAPDRSRLTPLPLGTRVNISGKLGNNYRFKMGEKSEGWLAANDIKLLPEGTPSIQSFVLGIDTVNEANSVLVKVQLTQRLPISVEETPDSQINLTLYGARSDLSVVPYNNSDLFINEIKWTQISKDIFRLTFAMNSNQIWGYDYYYEGNTLVFKIKKPPVADKNNVINGRIITIDPGHGGTERGSIGLTGIPEKTINLAISKYLEEMLINSGATVIMTRNTDNENPWLYDRTKMAASANSDVLVSIHNNALSDGQNPYIIHGSGTYYYYSQALPLAKSIQKSLVENLKLRDNGIFWDSLALTRAHEQPSVLVEVGFMINPDEYMLLADPEFQKKAAAAIYQGLENFFKANP